MDVSLSPFLLIISIAKAALRSISTPATAISATSIPATAARQRISLSSLSVDALLLSDGGYGPSTPPGWLETLDLARGSIGTADDYESFPDQAVLESLEGRNVLRTDRNGLIELMTDGEQMWVEAEIR